MMHDRWMDRWKKQHIKVGAPPKNTMVTDIAQRITPFSPNNSLFHHMKITLSVTKSSNQDHGLCAIYTHLFLSYTSTLLFCWEIKSCCDGCFPQQNRNIIL